ncbi:MAG: PorT family protein [Gemmatimonadota bacterium]|nr:MAG: PorT family protein [Gemmatimonadota bacterium]
MKRAMLGVAVVFGLALAGVSDAQAQGITLGAQGGYNYAQLADVPTDFGEISDKGSFVVGAFLDIQFHNLLFLGVEGNYLENKFEATDGSGTWKQNYVQIPAYLGVRLLKGMLQPVLYAGAAANFETTCTVSEGDLSVDCSDLDLSTNSAIWNAVFGGGVDVALGAIRLNGDIRYNLGLTKVEETEDAKWNNWMFLVGVGFGLGG